MHGHQVLGINRRQYLGGLAGAAAGVMAFGGELFAKDGSLPPVRVITPKSKYHWFGYYDKLQFDPTNRFVLGMEVDFEHRSPEPDDTIGIGMVDLQDRDRWIPLGRSRAWSWQQGCMLQWVPGTDSKVLWNDREGDRFVCRIVDTQTKETHTIDSPIYTLSPDGKTAVVPDFSRLNDVRPGYGYVGLPDRHAGELAPEESGIWRVDLESGKRDLIISLAQIAVLEPVKEDMRGAKHWFNHLLYNTDGTRFEFLHRWRPKGKMGWKTRMLTATPDGKDIHVIDDNGLTSHFIWRDPQHILAFSSHPPHGRGFYIFKDGSSEPPEIIGKGIMTVDGHCTYLPGNEWILNDTYPDKDRLQNPYLFEVKTGRRVPLGHFRSPRPYEGEWRCDNHPRFSRDGKSVVIDSPHDGNGRQMYLIDVSEIVG